MMFNKFLDAISPICVLILSTFIGMIAIPLGFTVSMFSKYDRIDAINDSLKETKNETKVATNS